MKNKSKSIVLACNMHQELIDAYRGLWVAVENGIKTNEQFFKLRERFRDVMSKAKGFENEIQKN